MVTDRSTMATRTQCWQHAALTSYLLLILLTLLWEGWLAPAAKAPPGFWLTLKGVLLLLPLFGMLRNKLRSYLWASLLVLLYFMEGTVLLYLHRADKFALHSVLPYALLETLLTVGFIVSASLHVRAARVAGVKI